MPLKTGIKQQKASDTQKKPTINKKTFKCKNTAARQLRKKAEKHGKNIMKKLENVNKGSTFAPATAKNAHRNTGRLNGLKEKKFSEKKIPKSLQELKKLFTFAPRKTRKAL